jgi:hypothetical protein
MRNGMILIVSSHHSNGNVGCVRERNVRRLLSNVWYSYHSILPLDFVCSQPNFVARFLNLLFTISAGGTEIWPGIPLKKPRLPTFKNVFCRD